MKVMVTILKVNKARAKRGFSLEKVMTKLSETSTEERIKYYQLSLEILSKNLEVKALHLLMNQDFKIIKTVFMLGQKKGKKFMVSKRENEAKEKI